MNRIILAITVLVTILVAACAPAATSPGNATPQLAPTVESMMDKGTPTPDAMMPKATTSPEAMMGKLPDQITTPHLLDSAPKHGDKFAQAPTQILINFDFTLHEDSAITVTREGAPVTTGKTTLGEKKLSLTATLPGDAGDGLYVVKYKACWPDRSCHDGQFAFTVDAKMKSSYLDLTGQSEVTVRLKGIKFEPERIIVSRGTKVTWINDDPVVHFVNSDPHPSHNVVATLNSLEIKKGDSFNYTFDQSGEWAIHCSAHVPENMLGRVIVLESAVMQPKATDAMIAKPTAAPTAAMTRKKAPVESLPPQLFSPHFVLSSPEHADLIAQAPDKVHIEFNFNLHSASNIEISKDGINVEGLKRETGPLSMDATLPSNSGDGLYLVRYKACWPDRSCHEGQFAFRVDSN